MERSNFFDDQYVLPEDLNNIETTKVAQIIGRSQGLLGDSGGISLPDAFSVAKGGIYGSPADYADISRNFFATKDSLVQITVAAGVALTSAGELIQMPAFKTMVLAGSDTHYAWPVGSVDSTNYIKLSYQESSGSIKYPAVVNTHAYSLHTASYYLQIDNVAPVTNEILIGKFVAGSSGTISGSVIDCRTYVRMYAPAAYVRFDPALLAPGLWRTLEAHVRATGSTAATATNPHGLIPGDIGAATQIVNFSPATASIAVGTIYQNPSGSTMYVSAVVLLTPGPGSPSFDSSVSLYVGSASGSSGLQGDIYEVSNREVYFYPIPPTRNDTYKMKSTIGGFVPPHWFYKFAAGSNPSIGATNPTLTTGTVEAAVRYF